MTPKKQSTEIRICKIRILLSSLPSRAIGTSQLGIPEAPGVEGPREEKTSTAQCNVQEKIQTLKPGRNDMKSLLSYLLVI